MDGLLSQKEIELLASDIDVIFKGTDFDTAPQKDDSAVLGFTDPRLTAIFSTPAPRPSSSTNEDRVTFLRDLGINTVADIVTYHPLELQKLVFSAGQVGQTINTSNQWKESTLAAISEWVNLHLETFGVDTGNILSEDLRGKPSNEIREELSQATAATIQNVADKYPKPEYAKIVLFPDMPKPCIGIRLNPENFTGIRQQIGEPTEISDPDLFALRNDLMRKLMAYMGAEGATRDNVGATYVFSKNERATTLFLPLSFLEGSVSEQSPTGKNLHLMETLKQHIFPNDPEVQRIVEELETRFAATLGHDPGYDGPRGLSDGPG